MTIKCRDKYWKISNGYNTYFVQEKDTDNLGKALRAGSIIPLTCLSVLDWDEEGHLISSKWPDHVRCEASLRRKLNK